MFEPIFTHFTPTPSLPTHTHTHTHTHTGLTHAGDPLCDQVLEQGVQHGTVSGVQLVAVDADVETQPVGVRLRRHLSGWCELLLLLVRLLIVPDERGEERRGEEWRLFNKIPDEIIFSSRNWWLQSLIMTVSDKLMLAQSAHVICHC